MTDNKQFPDPGSHPDAEGFLRALALSDKPDPLTRLQFADWLDEHGYDRAAQAQRWAARMKKSPEKRGVVDAHGITSSGGWYNAGRPATRPLNDGSFREVARRLINHLPEYLPNVFFSVHNNLWNDWGESDPLGPERNFTDAGNRVGWTEEGEPTHPLFHGMTNEEANRRAAVSGH
jgi:uncharacterized protein (TIGR02996 family)